MTKDQKNLGRVLVLGMGMTGEYVARYCAALLGQRVFSVTLYGGLSSHANEASQSLVELGVTCVLGAEDIEGDYDLCIASPGISEFSDFFLSAKSHSIEIISEPEFAWRESPHNWVAITGTNGKTTTTSLTTALLHEGGLRATSVGNIGYLASKALDGRERDEWFVAELSSYQLACSKTLHPRVAVLLNITPDHLSWHKTLENYAAAKERIFANLEAGDLGVISYRDAWCRAIAQRLMQRGLRVCRIDPTQDVGGEHAAFVREGRLVVRLDGQEHTLAEVRELRLKGEHNIADALAACAAALELGCSDLDIVRCLQEFSPLEHRIEPCGEFGGVCFINDSKATNTDAVEQALKAFDAGTIVLLLGGHDKGTDISELAEHVVRRCAAAFCFGEAGPRFAEALKQAQDQACEQKLTILPDGEVTSQNSTPDFRLELVSHLSDAFDGAWDLARPGQTVLLSPACSSFDEFSGFEERGRYFKNLVATRIAAEGGLDE